MNAPKIFILALLSFSSVISCCDAIKINFSQPTSSADGSIVDTEITNVNLHFKTLRDSKTVTIDKNLKSLEVSLDSILNGNPSELVTITADVFNEYGKSNVKPVNLNAIDTSVIDTINLTACYSLDPSWDYTTTVLNFSADITYK